MKKEKKRKTKDHWAYFAKRIDWHRYRAVGQQLPKWSGKQYPCAGVKSDGGSSDSNTGCASGDSLSFVHPSRNERGGGGGDGDGGGSGGDSGGGG
ncbi:hypothetical protein HZH66_001739 [Vespula vulgaris]|uniref:Uncharacterized protein n=1 Tax=Vespula vulgaris TaxID=7454 RepID=A0A834KJS1_VESVU|nr:hypothetical protein HZH66_001739 [Vespula vulgaris]